MYLVPGGLTVRLRSGACHVSATPEGPSRIYCRRATPTRGNVSAGSSHRCDAVTVVSTEPTSWTVTTRTDAQVSDASFSLRKGCTQPQLAEEKCFQTFLVYPKPSPNDDDHTPPLPVPTLVPENMTTMDLDTFDLRNKNWKTHPLPATSPLENMGIWGFASFGLGNKSWEPQAPARIRTYYSPVTYCGDNIPVGLPSSCFCVFREGR